MPALDDILSDKQRARLIPSVADSLKEQRLVSILLATLSVVRPFTSEFLQRLAQKLGKSSTVAAYTEVEFPAVDGKSSNRPDGLLCVTTRKSRWTALIEAKIDKHDIAPDQVQRYIDIARRFNIDAVITLSNQLVALPTHVPYAPPKRSTRVQLFHLSWISVRTQAQLILKDQRDLDPTQEFILEEMVAHFEHATSGIRTFDQMNAEWRPLVLGIRDGRAFTRSSPEIEKTIASWHQEERDLCLILSRRIGKQVHIRRLSKKHMENPELRLRDACDNLVNHKELRSTLTIPNAASDLEVTADLQKRTLACAMTLNVPLDKQGAKARINWLRSQLRPVTAPDVQVRAFWPGRAPPTQARLADVQADSKALEHDLTGIAPRKFEIMMIRDNAGRFPGSRAFIEDLEQLVPTFYKDIGQHLRPWTPPPPPIDKADPIRPATTTNAPSTEVADTTTEHDPKASTATPLPTP